MEITIRNEQTRDIDAVREILRAAFPTDAESRLVDALRSNGKAIISLVAVNGDDVLGHILFSPVSITPPGGVIPSDGASPLNNCKGLGLAPVAVRTDVQSQGIGSQLIREGLRRSKELAYDFCVVLGSPKYYQRFGFEKASNNGIQNEYGVDDEFMWIRFTNCDVSGLARYAAEFGLFSV